VWEDGRMVSGEGWQEKVHNREERKKLLRMARNCHILHMPMEQMNNVLIFYVGSSESNAPHFFSYSRIKIAM
jgi:hypothetical protein